VSLNEFNLADATITLRPLMFFVFGMAIYSVYIFRFYRFLARKNIFDLDFKRYETSRVRVVRSVLHLVFYIVKYLMLFPWLAFFWFAVMTLMLAFLGKNQTTETTLMVSMAVVSAVRITAYYDENLSDELAKVLPFALLGVFLVEPTYFSFPASINLLQQAITQWENMAYYLLFVVALEFVLRLTTPVLKPLIKASQNF
jgi:hypothetical protein